VDPKVFINGNMVFGFTSSFRMGQLLQYSLKIPMIPKDEAEYHAYMCTKFVGATKTLFDENGVEGGQFLVGFNGHLYMVEGDYQVGIERTPYNSVGCGEAYAKGALHIINSHFCAWSPHKKITEALKAATLFSTGVEGPYNILSV
jgi:hypothetical protein